MKAERRPRRAQAPQRRGGLGERRRRNEEELDTGKEETPTLMSWTAAGNHEVDDMEAGVSEEGNQRGGAPVPTPNAPMDARADPRRSPGRRREEGGDGGSPSQHGGSPLQITA
jgi:hypothetical protein